jgi:hypothetical protein
MRLAGAFVIGRSTAFTYKGKVQIGRELALSPAFTIGRFRDGAESDNPVCLKQRHNIYAGLRKAAAGGAQEDQLNRPHEGVCLQQPPLPLRLGRLNFASDKAESRIRWAIERAAYLPETRRVRGLAVARRIAPGVIEELPHLPFAFGSGTARGRWL